jgi:hypothetical protein
VRTVDLRTFFFSSFSSTGRAGPLTSSATYSRLALGTHLLVCAPACSILDAFGVGFCTLDLRRVAECAFILLNTKCILVRKNALLRTLLLVEIFKSPKVHTACVTSLENTWI